MLGPFDHVSEPMRVRAHALIVRKLAFCRADARDIEADERLPEAALEVRRAMRLRDELRTSGAAAAALRTRSICSTRKCYRLIRVWLMCPRKVPGCVVVSCLVCVVGGLPGR